MPKAARNELFYFIARASQVFTVAVALPVAGFLLTRVINQQDEIQKSLQQQTIDLRVFSATMKDKLDTTLSRQNDQELRLRTLEQRR